MLPKLQIWRDPLKTQSEGETGREDVEGGGRDSSALAPTQGRAATSCEK